MRSPYSFSIFWLRWRFRISSTANRLSPSDVEAVPGAPGRAALRRFSVSETRSDGNVSSMKRTPAAWQVTSKSTPASVGSVETPGLFKIKMNCRPKTVEITRLVSAMSDAVGLANTSNGSLGEYSKAVGIAQHDGIDGFRQPDGRRHVGCQPDADRLPFKHRLRVV